MLWSRAYFYVQIAMVLFALTTEAKKKRNRKKDHYADEPIDEIEAVNVCSIAAPTIIYCYCDKEQFNEAEDGNCWVFNDTSMKEHADIWEDFSSQNRIKHFTLHLRPDGTVKRIPTIALMHLREIEKFEIQYATIDVLHSFAFANSSTLQMISVSRNNIGSLQTSAFANLKNVSKIVLGENHLTEINRDVFVHLPKLTHLFIESNNITRIADYAFHNLQALRELDLFSNQIKVIVPATFIGLENLERLDLHRNWIEVIGDKTFQYLKSLKTLDLHGNSIKFVSPKGFYGLTNLRKLNLQDNKLLALGADIFKSSEKLSYLDLSQNVLDTIEEDAFYPIRNMLKEEGMVLVLKGNILRCDTRLKWMFGLYNETNSRIVKETLDEIHCYLETGTLPPRFEPLPTPNYEVTTLGIGPRVELMKLLPAELPDPMLRTPSTFTEADCDDDNLKSTQKPKPKKGHRGNKRRPKHKTPIAIDTDMPATRVEQKNAQNDMASPPTKTSHGGPTPELRPAAPVQESMAYNDDNESSATGHVTALTATVTTVVALMVSYCKCRT